MPEGRKYKNKYQIAIYQVNLTIVEIFQQDLYRKTLVLVNPAVYILEIF